jgi:arylsulfatase A-like enzyme
LLFMLPFRLEQELVVEPLVRNVDIWPTILDLVGLPPLPHTDGVSRVPLMQAVAHGETGETAESLSYLDQTWGRIEAEPAPLVSIRNDGQRLLYRPKKPEASEIYDLAMDPRELRNLKKSPPEWAEPLQTELETRLEQPVPWTVTEVKVDELDRGQLRALGYLIAPGPPK